jgi:hypothetical protein
VAGSEDHRFSLETPVWADSVQTTWQMTLIEPIAILAVRQFHQWVISAGRRDHDRI